MIQVNSFLDDWPLLAYLDACEEGHVVLSWSENDGQPRSLWSNRAAQHIKFSESDRHVVEQAFRTGKTIKRMSLDAGTFQATKTTANGTSIIVLRCLKTGDSLEVLLKRGQFSLSDIVLSYPWENTPFGPMRGWSQPLRDAVVCVKLHLCPVKTNLVSEAHA